MRGVVLGAFLFAAASSCAPEDPDSKAGVGAETPKVKPEEVDAPLPIPGQAGYVGRHAGYVGDYQPPVGSVSAALEARIAEKMAEHRERRARGEEVPLIGQAFVNELRELAGRAHALLVEAVLDDFHDAASKADGLRYFAHFADDAVFLGTDATERWSVAEFQAYAEPYFSQGKGWTYVASERHVTLARDGLSAWFDERLQNAKYGEVRGSGVLVRDDAGWRIAQYNLAFPVPNEKADEFLALLRGE